MFVLTCAPVHWPLSPSPSPSSVCHFLFMSPQRTEKGRSEHDPEHIYCYKHFSEPRTHDLPVKRQVQGMYNLKRLKIQNHSPRDTCKVPCFVPAKNRAFFQTQTIPLAVMGHYSIAQLQYTESVTISGDVVRVQATLFIYSACLFGYHSAIVQGRWGCHLTLLRCKWTVLNTCSRVRWCFQRLCPLRVNRRHDEAVRKDVLALMSI